MVTWHNTIFLQSKMQHRVCEFEGLFLIHHFPIPDWLTPTPSSLGWVIHTGSEEPWLLLWALARESQPSWRLHVPPGCSPRVSMLLPKSDSPQTRARLQQPIPGIPGNPSALCLTSFIPGFTPVFIPEPTVWPNRWVELESPVSQPGGACLGCCRAARH